MSWPGQPTTARRLGVEADMPGALGWEVYRTFYVSDATHGVIVAAAVALLAIDWIVSRHRSA